MQDTYVTGGLAGLLQTYLDQQNIHEPEISLVLAKFSADSRMPTTIWRELLEKIQRIQPQVAMGLKIGRLSRPHHFGVLGYLIMHCSTLGEALGRFQQYQVLVHNFSRVQVQIKDGKVIMSWDTEQGTSTQLSDEVFLSCFITFIEHITQDKRVSPIALHFIEQHCGQDVRRDIVDLMVIPKPFEGANPFQVIKLMELNDPLMRDIFLWAEKTPVKDILLTTLAQTLNLTERTLARKVKSASGLSTGQFVRLIKLNQASELLIHSNKDINSVSEQLGFVDDSGFRRMFKKVSKYTPGEYRQQFKR